MKSSQMPAYLSIVTAVVLGRVPPLKGMNERHLAKALRTIGKSVGASDRHFLRALADVLDDPDACLQLQLSHSVRGRPKDHESRLKRAMLYGPMVDARLSEGEKKEAAIQFVMDSFGVSRASILRALQDYTRLKRPAPSRLTLLT